MKDNVIIATEIENKQQAPGFIGTKITFIKGENDHTPWYYKKDMEAFRIENGSIKVVTKDSTVFADEGDILFVSKGVIHKIIGTTDSVINMITFQATLFDPEGSVEGPIRRLFSSSIFMVNKILSTSNIGKRANDCFKESYSALTEEKEEAEVLSLNSFSSLFLLLIKAYSNKIKPSKKETIGTKKVKSMMDYINANISSSISLGTLAKLIKASPRETMRLFKGELDESPIQFAMSVKLYKGLEEILLDPTTPINLIAKKLGFNSPSYFTELFTREYNAKPSEISTKRNITKWTEDPFGSLNKFFGG